MARSYSGGRFAGFNPSDPNFSGKGGEGIGGAAFSSLADDFAAQTKGSPDYDGMLAGSVTLQSKLRQGTDKIMGEISKSVIEGAGDVTKYWNYSKGRMEASEKEADAKKEAGAIGFGAQIIGAGLALFTSDERTKHTINEIEQATSLLRGLRPVTFYYKDDYTDDPKRKHYGFIAQEYERLMPDATYTDENSGMKCINMQELIALLVSANQELESRIRRLEVKEALKPVVAGVR